MADVGFAEVMEEGLDDFRCGVESDYWSGERQHHCSGRGRRCRGLLGEELKRAGSSLCVGWWLEGRRMEAKKGGGKLS